MLSKESIEEYQKIMKEQYGQDLSVEINFESRHLHQIK